jgi:hypothetical protein
MKLVTITPQFVELMPPEIQDGVIYISEKYAMAIHKCCCGCGMKVVISLSPARWQLRREGSLVTLYPSIGNWDFPCRSHYWIRRNSVVWSGSMTQQEVRRVKERDKRAIKNHIFQSNKRKIEDIAKQTEPNQASSTISHSGSKSLWQLFKEWMVR